MRVRAKQSWLGADVGVNKLLPGPLEVRLDGFVGADAEQGWAARLLLACKGWLS